MQGYGWLKIHCYKIYQNHYAKQERPNEVLTVSFFLYKVPKKAEPIYGICFKCSFNWKRHKENSCSDKNTLWLDGVWIMLMYAFVKTLDMYTYDFCISVYVNYMQHIFKKFFNLTFYQIPMTWYISSSVELT